MSYIAKMLCRSRVRRLHKHGGPDVRNLLTYQRGEADADHDGWVSLGELYNYAKPRVADESQRLGYTQTMQLLSQTPGAQAGTRLAKAR